MKPTTWQSTPTKCLRLRTLRLIAVTFATHPTAFESPTLVSVLRDYLFSPNSQRLASPPCLTMGIRDSLVGVIRPLSSSRIVLPPVCTLGKHGTSMGGNIASSAPRQHWPAPNYENPVTRDWLPIFLITFHGFASILVAIRVALRFQERAGGFGVDDVSTTREESSYEWDINLSQAFLVPAWVMGTGLVAFASWSSFEGIVDRHAWDVRPERLWMLPLV